MAARVMLVMVKKMLASKFFQWSWYPETTISKGERPVYTPKEKASIIARIGRL